MNLDFLKTEQKNEHIQHTNFDMSHYNNNTFNLGELKVTQLEPILPSDSAELKVNDEVICQAMDNPSFSHFKLCHKTFYMPYCNLWKYWNNFITEKPDFTWTSSDIQSYIESEQPYTPPYFTWNDILPIVAFARGFVDDLHFAIFPIQDGKSDGYVNVEIDVSGSRNNCFIRDLLNMGHLTQDDLTSSHFFPRVLSYNASGVFVPFDSNDEDTTVPDGSNSTRGSLMANDLYTFLSSIQNNPHVYFVKPNSFDIIDPDTDYNKFRVCLLFHVTEFKRYQFEVISKNVKYADWSYLKRTSIGSGGVVISQQTTFNSSIVNQVIVGGSTEAINNSEYYCLPLPAGFECSQYRMSQLAYLWYLCRNAVKLLDSMSIPVYTERLSQRYAQFDAMPFFAYSRQYHEFFANKQLQVNAPDWSESNGPLCPEYSSSDSPKDHYAFGWILHHPEIPYNVNRFNYDEKLIIRNKFQAVCLLLGLNLNSLLFSEALTTFNIEDTYTRTSKPLSHTYMIYNGLLHLQYCNFPPDYFTEALLDPLAGAKDINIPSTITQLQEKSKLQDFLNQTAWTRNIKEWLQSQWDSFSKYTTVNEPSLCGSSDVDINISQVLQTSETSNTPLGTRAGVGSGYGNGYLCKQQFGDYGVLMTMSYICLDTMYVNRFDVRQKAKSSRFDYPLPQFANLGNEAIYPEELNFEGSRQITYGNTVYNSYISDTALVPGFKTTALETLPLTKYSQSNGQYVPDNAVPQIAQPSLINRVFGYIPRYSIYKHHMDEVHGDFLTTLRRWVPSRELNHYPTYLNYVFLSYELASQTSDLLKNFVNTTPFGDDNFLVNHLNILHMRRALPYIVKPQL